MSFNIDLPPFDPTKCAHCGHPSPKPYEGYEVRKVKWDSITEVKCPKCNGVYRHELIDGHSGYNRVTITQEEKEARQIGKPSPCCQVPFIANFAYYRQTICKKCNGQFFGAHSDMSYKEEANA